MFKLKSKSRLIWLTDGELIAELEEIEKQTSLSMSQIVSLRLKGYAVVPTTSGNEHADVR